MRYRPIQAAARERVPISLWGRSRARTVLAAVAASAAALVPALTVASPAHAVSTYVTGFTGPASPVAEGTNAVFNATFSSGGAPGDDKWNVVVTGGGGAGGSDWTAPGAQITWTSGGTAQVTVPILADQTVETGESITVTLTNNTNTSDTVAASVNIADVGYTLTAAPVTETVATPAVGQTPAVQKKARVTATLASAAAYNVAIPITVGQNGDTAVNGSQVSDPTYRDYDAPGAQTISITAGQTSGYYEFNLYDDALDEDDTQYITVVTPTSGRIGASPIGGSSSGGTVQVNITDDDATPNVQIAGAGAVREGNSLGFPLTLSAASERPVSVTVTTANGVTSGSSYGATAPGDYTPLNGVTATIPAYQTSVSKLVTTLSDNLIEASPETFSATISNPTNAVLGTTTTAQGGINDGNSAPTLDVSTSATTPNTLTFSTEGATGETAKALTFTLGTTSTIPVVINYTFGGGTATLGADYKATNGSITVPAGSTTATVPVSIVGDTIYEPGNETFNVTLSSPNSSVDFTPSATRTFTITDDDATSPSYSIADASVTEGNTGTTTARVPLTLSGATNADVVFTVSNTFGANPVTGAVELGTNTGATSGADDYDAPASTVTVPAGSTTATIEIPIKPDTVYEKDQTFTVSATPAGGSQVNIAGAVTATVTIVNDDAAPKMTFNDLSGTEGTSLRVTAQVVGVSEYAYTVGLVWAGSGAAPLAASADDYTATGVLGSVNVTRGQTGTTPTGLNANISDIYINQDSYDEPTEQLAVTATETTSPVTGFATSTGTYKFNDDPGDMPPAASVGDATVTSDQSSVDVPVDLAFINDTTATTQTVKVPYWTENGDAKAGTDYTTKKGTLEYAPGELTKKINIPIMSKSRDDDMHFYVKLGTPTPSGATVTDGTGEVTIQSGDDNGGGEGDDDAPSIMVSSKLVGGDAASISGKAKPGATVELWGAPMGDDSDLKKISSMKADDDGDYKFSRWIGVGYRFQTRSDGHSSDEKECKVEQDPGFSATSPSRGMLNLVVTADPRDSNQAVIIQRYDKGKWVNAWRGTTNSNGQWRANVKANSRSSWQLRAFVAGYTPDGLLPGYSDGKRVTIK